MPVIKLVSINYPEGDFVGLLQVRLQPSRQCFAIPWGWNRNEWRQGRLFHYGRWSKIWQLRLQREEVSDIRTWTGEVLVTYQIIKLQVWEESTRVILEGRRGALYPSPIHHYPINSYQVQERRCPEFQRLSVLCSNLTVVSYLVGKKIWSYRGFKSSEKCPLCPKLLPS